MINQIAFQKCLKNAGVEFITGVPDTLLNEFCLSIEENWPKNKHIIAANEGNAAALACGYHLSTGSIPLVYMQNSGMGNTLNPLLSLSNKDVYGVILETAHPSKFLPDVERILETKVNVPERLAVLSDKKKVSIHPV